MDTNTSVRARLPAPTRVGRLFLKRLRGRPTLIAVLLVAVVIAAALATIRSGATVGSVVGSESTDDAYVRAASWELDLFGKVRRQKQSAQAAADAAVEPRRGILVSLTAAVASTYLSLRATELRVQIARANLDIAGKRNGLPIMASMPANGHTWM